MSDEADQPGISVVLTVLNEGDNMRYLMDALVGQTRIPDEIVIVDGGSTDGTANIIESYRDRVPVRCFIEPGVNIARGRNIAIEHARHGIIAVTDGGCLPAPTWLEALVRPLLSDPTVGAVSGRLKPVATSKLEYFAGLLSIPRLEPGEPADMFYGRSSAFRKSAWGRIGGYPEWLYTAEDTLFSLRARSLGVKIAYAPESVLAWRPRATLRKVARMFFLYGRGNGRIRYGNMRGTLYWLRNHLLWLGTLVAGLFYPEIWLATLAIVAYMYLIMIAPVMRDVRARTRNPWREFYVPLIVLIRNMATNLGYLYGSWEQRSNPIFRERLRAYGWDPDDQTD